MKYSLDPEATPERILERIASIWEMYAEVRQRDIAQRLTKSRVTIPADELIAKSIAVLQNPPVLDRRIRDLPEPAKHALVLMALMRRVTIPTGTLLILLSALGHQDGFTPILTLLEQGLAVPATKPEGPVEQFESLFGSQNLATAEILVPPQVSERALGLPLPWPALPAELDASRTARQTDGYDWPLRLAVLRQRLEVQSIRLTQSQCLFKRDLIRLQTDELLQAPLADELTAAADLGVLAFLWALRGGLLQAEGGDVRVATFPAGWSGNRADLLRDLWSAWPLMDQWDPLVGYQPLETGVHPTATVGCLAVWLLIGVPAGQWTRAEPVADWLWTRHPGWGAILSKDEQRRRGRGWIEAFWLSVAYPLQLIEISRYDGELWVRLSPWGRALFGLGAEPAEPPAFPQCLLVQPNAEILAYRQGFTPELISKLTRFAEWKTLGAACTLLLSAERTYLGLESGLTAAAIQQTLNRHASKPVPATVNDLLRRWAEKRERLSLFPSAVLVEFQTPADLDEAMRRGLVSLRVTERIGLTDDGSEPDFKQLRLIGNRDYDAKPQPCLHIAADGVTLQLETAQSDLPFEADIQQIAEPILNDPPGLRRFRLTPESLRRAAKLGWTEAQLDQWFEVRANQGLPAAARLLWNWPEQPEGRTAEVFILEVESEIIADGLLQWPATARWIQRRLGPTALVVDPAQWPALQQQLTDLRAGQESQPPADT